MPMKDSKQWFMQLQWGKVALVSWGDTTKSPVLMIHGYMDSAATFIPLVERLPETHYYVSFDMPGHGRSDPFPKGSMVSTAEHIEVVRRIVENMKWDTVILITHSVGFLVGILYNYIYPNKVTKIVNLDPMPPLRTACSNQYDMPLWFQFFYQEYYDDYGSWCQELPKQFTYDEAVSTLMRNRKLLREQSEIILSRSWIPQDNGKYKLSWETRSKKLSSLPMSEDILYTIMSKNPIPMLNILASVDETIEVFKENGRRLLKKCQENIPNYIVLTVTGHHDVHLTNPERFVQDINEFLIKDFGKVKARL